MPFDEALRANKGDCLLLHFWNERDSAARGD